jgi:hypothetical protein
MSKKSKKKKPVSQIPARKGAVDVFLNGVPVLSIWTNEQEKIECRVFDALVQNDYRSLAWCLSRMANVLVEMDSKRVVGAEKVGKVITMPDAGKIII